MNKRAFLLNERQAQKNEHLLGKLGSYILTDTPEPQQLTVRGTRPTIKQLKRGPVSGTDALVREPMAP